MKILAISINTLDINFSTSAINTKILALRDLNTFVISTKILTINLKATLQHSHVLHVLSNLYKRGDIIIRLNVY